MAERNSWAVSDTGGVLTVEDGRLALGAHVFPGATNPRARSGFRPGPTDPALVLASGTPDGFVHVNPFQLFMQSGRGTEPGMYVQTLDAIKDINILSTPADPTNPRDDLVIAQQSDKFYADAANTFLVKQVVGTPAGVPADPTVTGSPDFLRLARVRVNANATTITQANITNLRQTTGFGTGIMLPAGLFTVALGGVLPVGSLTQRDAIVGKYDGLAVWRQDLKRIEIWTGAAWRVFSRPTEDLISASETTTSTAYTDLATVGPTVTLETGDAATVDVYGGLTNSTVAAISFMGFAVSGATTRAAADPEALQLGVASGSRLSGSASFLITGLTAGTNTFRAKYRVDSGTGTFYTRKIKVRPE